MVGGLIVSIAAITLGLLKWGKKFLPKRLREFIRKYGLRTPIYRIPSPQKRTAAVLPSFTPREKVYMVDLNNPAVTWELSKRNENVKVRKAIHLECATELIPRAMNNSREFFTHWFCPTCDNKKILETPGKEAIQYENVRAQWEGIQRRKELEARKSGDE